MILTSGFGVCVAVGEGGMGVVVGDGSDVGDGRMGVLVGKRRSVSVCWITCIRVGSVGVIATEVQAHKLALRNQNAKST